MSAEARSAQLASSDVLVVDADVHERRLVAHALERAGFSVVEAATGLEALAQVESRPFAAMLLAESMPDVSGADVVRHVRDRDETRAMAVLLLTAADEMAGRAQPPGGAANGANATIARPLHAAELVAHVRAHMGRPAHGEPTVETRLRERANLAGSLATLKPQETPEETGRALCRHLVGGEVQGAVIVAFPGDGTAAPLAVSGTTPAIFGVRRPLPPAEAFRMQDRARGGPWCEQWSAADDGLRPWPPASNRRTGGGASAEGCIACAPLVANREVLGVLMLCTAAESQSSAALHMLAAAIDYGSVARDLLVPSLLERGHLARRRADIEHVIEERAFATVFQPIVDLVSQEVAGFEALTRFHDGSAPADRFAEAARIAMGTDLEAAALKGALTAARGLPAQVWLSVNVSPALVLEGDRLEAAVADADRPIVLELTEHDPVEDYDALRQAVRRLGPRLQLSIDDAGSGFASLRHVLALDPAFVKLDQSWVHHVHADPARQALLAGLVYFASRTGCRLIAEGVETEADLATLQSLEVELGQGFLLGRPAPVDLRD